LNRYASTVFAFGQTGAGKTFTMAGSAGATSEKATKARAAMLPSERPPQLLYQRIDELRSELKFTVRATYLEIYNEQVADLISPAPHPLAVRWSPGGGFYVEDLSVVKCRGLRDLLYVIEKGLQSRHVRCHRLNSESSRYRFY
ncbi:P-loop containing nucleoside triphosphate hydrolase protein, partial [Pavlovales sp. CCMP2436]